MNIGADVSYNFEPTYMSYMANTLIDHFDISIETNTRAMIECK